ncbi:hypothetical protein AEM51_02600 [Bacteroidetes bacterium UKL13-3]|nr:hypothetical protein AEM51_02600 [Bacteroidetes bacterium UKL13-3]HCP93367.1 DNA-binding response regulator [Bacteroidota bacterium]
MNIVIIEDEAPALTRIQKLVREVDATINILATADSIESAVNLFNQYKNIELVLMDIELADGQSFEIFNRVEVLCPVIFTTAYDEFALKAFKVNSIDYLLKPIVIDDLRQAISKFNTFKNIQSFPNYQHQLESILSTFTTKQTSYKNRFLIKVGTKMVSIAVDQIAYFHASEKLVYLYTQQGQKHIVDYSLDELSQLLEPTLFFQLNRQFVANIMSIQSVHTYYNGKLKVALIPTFSEDVTVSRERAADFKSWLDS